MSERNATRRRLLRAAGLAAVAGLAGCTSEGMPDSLRNETTGTTETTPKTTASSATTRTTRTTTAEPTTEAPPTPHGLREVHFHGRLVLVLDGRRYHFDRPKYMEERTGIGEFHFHTDGKADTFHVHARDVTLGWAADAMPDFDLAADAVTYEGRTYSDADPGTTVEIEANGAAVDPATYVLEPDDTVTVRVETDRPVPTPPGGNATDGNASDVNG